MGGGGHARTFVVAAVLAALLLVTVPAVPPARAATPHAPIRIVGNAGFTPANGVTGGSGTPSDPYVISGWDVNASTYYGVEVLQTDAPFVLRDLVLHGGGGLYAGVRFYNVSNARMENVTATGNAPGFRLEDSRNVTIASSVATGNDNGIEVLYSWGVTVTGSRISLSRLSAFWVFESDLVNFSGNHLTDNPSDVYVRGDARPPSNVTISGNDARSTDSAVSATNVKALVIRSNVFTGANAVRVTTAAGVDIAGNTFDGAGAYGSGPIVADSENVAIRGNNVTGSTGWGLRVERSRNVTVRANTLWNNTRGLSLRSVSNATLGGNRVTGTGVEINSDLLQDFRSLNVTPDNVVNGLPFDFCRGCSDLTYDGPGLVAQAVFVDCQRVRLNRLRFTGVEMALVLANVRDAVLSSTTVSDTPGLHAVLAIGGDNLTFQDNNVTGNVGYGLRVADATNVTVTRNTFADGWTSVSLERVTNATLHRNNLIHNANQAWDFGPVASRWDAGYPTGGNYWSSYTGQDLCSGPNQNVCTGGDGLGDTPIEVWPQGTDTYPRVMPYGIPARRPVANFSMSTDAPVYGELVSFDAGSSFDPDGTIVRYAWDFEDAGTGWRVREDRYFPALGPFNVSLTVTDNSGLTSALTLPLRVFPPQDYPQPMFYVDPEPPYYVGEAVRFDGSGSLTPSGSITSYAWDLGDGTAATGALVEHVYATPGLFTVHLSVTNSWGFSGNVTALIDVQAPPMIDLTTYTHPSGFQVPLPRAWSVTQDAQFGDSTFAYAAYGPYHGRFQTNLLVATGRDSTVQEDRAYLEDLVQGTLDDLRRDRPDVHPIGAPEYKAISGHSGVVFAFGTPSEGIAQRAAVVVSEAHGRYWILMLSVEDRVLGRYNETFDRIVEGFLITAMPPAEALGIVGGLAGAAVAIVVIAVLLHRRRKRAATPRSPAAPEALPCDTCGKVAAAGDRFCMECGRPLPGSGPPDLPPPRP